MSEKFNLKWNDFQTNVSKAFGLLRNETCLQDVTLVSEDFKHIPAHKLVLSACSEYFKRLFQETKQSQPLICLDGVSSTDLQNVLDYVYEGEVRILQEDLDRFLSISQRLKLDGLMGGNENVGENDQFQAEYDWTKIEANTQNTVDEEYLNEPDDYKVETLVEKAQEVRRTNPVKTIAISGDNLNIEDHKKRLEEHIIINPDNSLTCRVCGKVVIAKQSMANGKQKMRNHVETHIEGLSYPCQYCDKTFRSKNSYLCHKSAYHKF